MTENIKDLLIKKVREMKLWNDDPYPLEEQLLGFYSHFIVHELVDFSYENHELWRITLPEIMREELKKREDFPYEFKYDPRKVNSIYNLFSLER